MPEKFKFCVILGGGGHAAVVIDAARAAGLDIVRAVLDPNAALWGTNLLGVPIEGGDDRLAELIERGADCFTVGVGSGDNTRARQRVFQMGLDAGLTPMTVVHPRAWVSPEATLGEGAQVLPQAVVHTRATVGRNAIVNCGAIVEHDCVVGDHVHIATGAKLAGGVSVGDGTHMGLGANVHQGIVVGSNACLAMGAVVVRDVPDGVLVVGAPARVLRKVRT